MKIIIGITGASGAIYGIKLLENLKAEKHLIISSHAKQIIKNETAYTLNQIKKITDFYYENENMDTSISSGSVEFDAMVIVPCSMSTLSKIAMGISDNLITRVASVCLKERRKLIIVPRETPLGSIHLKNMWVLSECGAVILPAMPAFYTQPKKIEDFVNFIVGRILDILGIEHKLYKRYKSK